MYERGWPPKPLSGHNSYTAATAPQHEDFTVLDQSNSISEVGSQKYLLSRSMAVCKDGPKGHGMQTGQSQVAELGLAAHPSRSISISVRRLQCSAALFLGKGSYSWNRHATYGAQVYLLVGLQSSWFATAFFNGGVCTTAAW